jgi:SAP domain-containing ribonucleoprotein
LISYSDDEATAAKPASAEATSAAGAAAANPSAPNPEETKVPETEAAALATEEEKPEPVSFAAGLSASSASDEAKKRAERAKRFGIEEDPEKKKLAERAERFGVEKDAVSGLDSALPDRPLKRGRGRNAEADGARPNKRQSQDRRGGRRDGRRGGGDAPAGNKAVPAKKSSILDDPVEKAKAEKRAARFGGA